MSNIITSKGIIFVDVNAPKYICQGTKICFLFKGACLNVNCTDLFFSSLIKALTRIAITDVVPLACTIFFIPDDMQKGDLFVCLVLERRYRFSRSFFKEILSSEESKGFLLTSTIYMATFRSTSSMGCFIDKHLLDVDSSSSVLYKEFNFKRSSNFGDVI